MCADMVIDWRMPADIGGYHLNVKDCCKARRGAYISICNAVTLLFESALHERWMAIERTWTWAWRDEVVPLCVRREAEPLGSTSTCNGGEM